MANDFLVRFGAQTAGYLAGVAEVSSASKSLVQELNAEFGRLTEAIRLPLDALAMMKSSLRETAEVAGVVFAVDKLKEFATEMAELGERTLNSAYLLGQSVGDYSQLSGAFTLVGGNAEEAQRTLERLALSVQRVSEGNKTATAAFHNLGISTAEVKAKGDDLSGLLTLIISRYAELTPSLRNIGVLHEIAGRGVDRLAGALRQGAEGWQEAMKGAEEYRRAMEENAAAMANSADQQHALELAVQTLSVDGFGAMKPFVDGVVGALTDFVNAMDRAIRPIDEAKGEMSGLEVAFRVVIQTVADVVTILHLFADTLALLLVAARENGEAMREIFIGIKNEIIAALTGGDIEAAYERMMGRLEAITVSRGAEIVAEWARITASINDLLGTGPVSTVLPDVAVTARRGGRALGTEGGPAGKKGKKGPARSEDDEDFSGGLNFQSEEQAASAMKQIDASYLQAFKANMQELVKSKQISTEQAIGFDEQYSGQLYAQERARLEAIISNDNYSVEDKQKVYNQLLELDARYTAQIAQDNEKIAAAQEEAAAKFAAPFTKAFEQMGSTFESTITGMLDRTTTFRQGLKKIFDQILSDFIKMLSDMASKWAGSQLMSMGFGTGAGSGSGLSSVLGSGLGDLLGGGGSGGLLSSLFGGGLSAGAAGAASGFGDAFGAGAIDLGTMGAGAAAAGGGGLSSIASLLPLLAFEKGGIIPSAAGGWAIPSFQGGGLLAQLHSGEMVLPADLSEGMQGMIRSGGGGGGTINIHAIDTQAGSQFLMKNRNTIGQAFRNASLTGGLSSRQLSNGRGSTGRF